MEPGGFTAFTNKQKNSGLKFAIFLLIRERRSP